MRGKYAVRVGRKPYAVEATYTNPAHLTGKLFRVSKDWHIEGSILVSSVGEQIVFAPGKKLRGIRKK